MAPFETGMDLSLGLIQGQQGKGERAMGSGWAPVTIPGVRYGSQYHGTPQPCYKYISISLFFCII